jgi:hypothetical protein
MPFPDSEFKQKCAALDREASSYSASLAPRNPAAQDIGLLRRQPSVFPDIFDASKKTLTFTL